jgi:hypothetical protein
VDHAAGTCADRSDEPPEQVAARDQRLGLWMEGERLGRQRHDQTAGAEVAGLALGEIEAEDAVGLLHLGPQEPGVVAQQGERGRIQCRAARAFRLLTGPGRRA